MKYNINDYIHFYWHCEGELKRYDSNDLYVSKISTLKQSHLNSSTEYIKPILRSINSITNEEMEELIKMISLFDLSECTFEHGDDGEYGNLNKWVHAIHNEKIIDAILFDGNIVECMNNNHTFSPLNPMAPVFAWLIKKEFDIFNLIRTGLAIDRITYEIINE